MQIPEVEDAVEVLEVLSQDELERERYEARLKAWRDDAIWETTLKEMEQRFAEQEKRFAEQIARMEQSRREAEQSRREAEQSRVIELSSEIEFLERLLKLPATPKDQLHGMAVDQLHQRVQQLRRQVLDQQKPANDA